MSIYIVTYHAVVLELSTLAPLSYEFVDPLVVSGTRRVIQELLEIVVVAFPSLTTGLKHIK